ncbi:MAG TPA: redoxin domain-containing protein [Patescibacteria group bacterium]
MLYKKKLLALSVLLIIFSPKFLFPQQKEKYEIDGQITGLKEGESIVMTLFNEWPQRVRRDSGYVKNGLFHIEGNVPEGPRIYSLVAQLHQNKSLLLILDNDQKITIHGKIAIDSIPTSELFSKFLSIEGSQTTKDYYDLRNAFDLYLYSTTRLKDYILHLKDSIGFDKRLMDGLMQSKNIISRSLLTDIFLQRPINTSIPLIMDNVYFWGIHDAFIKETYDNLVSLNKDFPNSYYGKKIKNEVLFIEGQPFPLFTLPTPQGNKLALKDLIFKSKITIVNFWNSNSFKVDEFQQELKEYYLQYKDKGLNIVGIYSDTSAKKWKLASADLPWYQVSDLKGEEGVIGKTYRQKTSATTNVLIDSQGNIIAWDASGIFLQYYLDKYLGDKK